MARANSALFLFTNNRSAGQCEVCKCTNKSILLLRKAIKEVEMARIYCTHQFFKKLVFASPVSNIQCCKIKFGQVKDFKRKFKISANFVKISLCKIANYSDI